MYTILIVEDESFIRKGLTQLVDYQSLGITTILEASSGEKALNILEENHVDILLTDINMPNMDGITLATKTKEYYPEIHIVFLTGYDYFDYALAALKLGADDYILKPVSKKDVETILKKVILNIQKEQKDKILLEVVDTQINDSKQNQMQQIINEHFTEPDFSLVKLANWLGFASTYTSTLIKKQFGMSFQDYVTEKRIAYAKILLLSSELKIYEVAQKVGYDDVNYFSIRFKQIVGMSPKKFQKGDSE
ncbi:response regulator [Granulicatella sp. zg-ZJ]|uniref:response regulator transcription factor n=1 Tax=unclassified Granulicatella TaxID=2630493 RepID=UPI0013C02647|nr:MULTISPECIES: response regulator [unclassified Granulicatella]MBS4751023.1 response regulator [Carnobacteriaceae bacterium zg-ZUI78]NEW62835.1 response regulator [Granulicatella sp. zg-ZJ]NEW65473.1 response regulator [Granulicatella sp. zg-84]QMI85266.1 response regulator [Carnobacteriaceae bacterium zg-84]